MAQKCKFINQSGVSCNAYPLKGSDYCFYHSPDISEEVKRQARAKGGKREPILAPRELKKAEQVALMMEEVINLAREEKISDKKATLLKGLSDSLLKALELGDIEERVEEIEDYIETKT